MFEVKTQNQREEYINGFIESRGRGRIERLIIVAVWSEKRFKEIHRTGIEPVPLAWKASMITTSPSV